MDCKLNFLLFLTSRVSWVSASSGEGFSLEYPHISLHAVSKDLSSFPRECLYLMLDSKLEESGMHASNFFKHVLKF